MAMTRDVDGYSVDLQGKVAAVLGASAEGGTGWAVAETLARCGAKVVVGARSRSHLDRLAERIGGTAVTCDAGEEDQVEAMARTTLDTYGQLDIAVNSAGLPVMSMIENMGKHHLDQALRVNFYGNFYFMKHMAAAIGTNGSIIFISSMSSTHPISPHCAYASAKAASDCMIRFAGLEYGPRDIRFNSILAGAIDSDMAKEAFENPEYARVCEREIPVGRVAIPQDIANTVLFLAGPAYATGLNLQISGGNQLTRYPTLDELPGGKEAFGSGKVLGDR